MIFKNIRRSLTSEVSIKGLAFSWRYSYETLFLIWQNEKQRFVRKPSCGQCSSPQNSFTTVNLFKVLQKHFLLEVTLYQTIADNITAYRSFI